MKIALAIILSACCFVYAHSNECSADKIAIIQRQWTSTFGGSNGHRLFEFGAACFMRSAYNSVNLLGCIECMRCRLLVPMCAVSVRQSVCHAGSFDTAFANLFWPFVRLGLHIERKRKLRLYKQNQRFVSRKEANNKDSIEPSLTVGTSNYHLI